MDQRLRRQRSKLLSFVPDGEDPKLYYRSLLDQNFSQFDESSRMGRTASAASIQAKYLASARNAVELIDQPEALAGKPEGLVDLGTLQLLVRPILCIRNRQISPPVAPPWNLLTHNAPMPLDETVCSIYLTFEGNRFRRLGTGVLIGRTSSDRPVVLTNDHIVATAVAFGWRKETGIDLRADFCETHDSSDRTLVFDAALPVSRDPTLDAALLYAMPADLNYPPLGYFRLQAEVVGRGLPIGAIGFPSLDTASESLALLIVQSETLGGKSMSPGLILDSEAIRSWRGKETTVMLHDATTLSGSSGSCIMDLSTKQIIGLHMGGWPKTTPSANAPDVEFFESNGAISLARLAEGGLLDRVIFASQH